ncbi:MAG: Omp28-related outer membrane protein [Bacteroidales bacterium]|nr:Omp28-related outer membrane protein [Bacteroidales bacterium]
MKLSKTIYLFTTLLAFSFYSYGQTPIKRVVVEESTGTWCASCAFGSVYFEHLENNYPNAIPIAVHTGPGGQDPMAIFSVELYMIPYFSGSPTFLFDRKDFPTNPSSKPAISATPWVTGLDTLDRYMDLVYNQNPLATVGVTKSYNSSTRDLEVTITANFIQNTTGDFRLNCFILEDSVTGGTEYNQANSNFSGWTSGPSYLQDLINAPAIISGYVHNHVLRETLGNPEGVTASIPSSVTSGSSYSKTFNFTLPTGYNENKISLVGLIQRYGTDVVNDREIVNANSVHLIDQTTSTSEYEVGIRDIRVYPNPVESKSNIEFYVSKSNHITCELYNINGQKIKTIFDKKLVQGEYRETLNNLNLTSGTYFLVFRQDGHVTNKKIVVHK